MAGPQLSPGLGMEMICWELSRAGWGLPDTHLLLPRRLFCSGSTEPVLGWDPPPPPLWPCPRACSSLGVIWGAGLPWLQLPRSGPAS